MDDPREGAPRKSARPSDGYHRALEECARVAREEFSVASDAIAATEQLAVRTKKAVADVVRRTKADGAAIEDARARLTELDSKLDGLLSSSLSATKEGLRAKQGVLSRFTVTLFGRTMAGKSTIREALTRGDGSTIGKGGQRTTRDIREYTWNSLRIIDTPGIGAYEGAEDRARALSVIDETDVVLFLVSSDGIQEESFKGMQELRQQNKPLIFVLNVKEDLTRPVFMRRFTKDPRSVFRDDDLRGHFARIHKLAGEYLGMRDIRIVPIHAQAAYLSTLPQYEAHSDDLAEACRLDDLLGALKEEVLRRGTVRRVQTVVDGTQVSLVDLEADMRAQAKTVRRSAKLLEDKFHELDIWFDGFVQATNSKAATESSQLVHPLRNMVSSFIDENIEREDVAKRWSRKVQALDIEGWLERQQASIQDELRARLAEFSKELAMDSKLVEQFGVVGPSQFDPWDVRRSLRWTAAIGGALAGVEGIAFWIAGTEFWNPVGWIAAGVGTIAFGLSWLFGDREKKLQRQKAKAAAQLRATIDDLEQRVASALKKWFYDNVTSRLVRAIRHDTKQLYTGMQSVSRVLEDSSRRVGELVEGLNRRLLVRAGHCVGAEVDGARLGRIVRDPGVRTKLLWQDETGDAQFCKQVGNAIGEWVDGIPEGPVAQRVAWSLRPAEVAAASVSLSGSTAVVRVAKSEVGRAIGRRGSNVSLASRLLGITVRVVPEGGHTHG